MHNEQHALLHLSLLKGIGPATIQKIIKLKPRDLAWSELYSLSYDDWISLGITPSLISVLLKGLADHSLVDKEQALIAKHGINWVTIADDHYPERLKTIYGPPPILYWRGELSSSDHRLAIVGARKTGDYGKQFIHDIVPPIIESGFEIVSGGAFGADSMAHTQTLDQNGTTIIVLGSGLLRPYPHEHRNLFERAVASGSVVMSSFSLETTPFPGNFPARNRIISGLSKGVIVVQAAAKSGARITAQYALDEGRDVFALPGDVNDELSAGCHALIQDGAKLVTNANDILSEYGYEQKTILDVAPVKKITPQSKPIPTRPLKPTYQYDQSSLEHRIIIACQSPQSFDELAILTNSSLSEIQSILFSMQMNSAISQNFTGKWQSI